MFSAPCLTSRVTMTLKWKNKKGIVVEEQHLCDCSYCAIGWQCCPPLLFNLVKDREREWEKKIECLGPPKCFRSINLLPIFLLMNVGSSFFFFVQCFLLETRIKIIVQFGLRLSLTLLLTILSRLQVDEIVLILARAILDSLNHIGLVYIVLSCWNRYSNCKWNMTFTKRKLRLQSKLQYTFIFLTKT